MFSKPFLKQLAKKESLPCAFLEKQLLSCRVVVPLNKRRSIERAVAIGAGCKVKINTNIGTSTEETALDDEIEKLKVAINFGTDTVMDLSVGNDVVRVRREIIKHSQVPVGTVPVYEAALAAERRSGTFDKMDFDDILSVLSQQAEDGVDFFTIHAGAVKKCLDIIQAQRRIGGIVSRGGAILVRWMYVNKRENPFYEHFDKILKLVKDYRITLSLGDALRPGAIADSSDKVQLSELYVLGELVQRARKKGVQVMVEGPGHLRLDEIAWNMFLEKEICDDAPFYVLGPLPIDTALGYDHIASSIGSALAAFHGADFLCVVTPAEHLRHPSCEDVKEGVIASKISAHAANVLRFKDEWDRDRTLSMHRRKREWEPMFSFALDREKVERYRANLKTSVDMCTMCGEFCSLKIIDKCTLLK